MKVLIIAASFFVLAFAAPRSNNNLRPFMENGKEVVPHSFPSTVFIQLQTSASHYSTCVGALIAPDAVLTSASCCDWFDIINGSAILGVHNLDANEPENTEIFIKEYIIHPKFDSYDAIPPNNLCIAKLQSIAPTSKSVAIAPLPEDSDNNYADAVGTVTAWGLQGKEDMSEVLLSLNDTIPSNDKCFHLLGIYGEQFEDSELCIRGYEEDTLVEYTDTGAPLYVDGTLVGIFSVVATTHELNGRVYYQGAVFSRVSSYLDWIKENI